MSAASAAHEAVGFTHVALFYAGDDEYVEATAPFIEEGVRLGEPVLVAVPDRRMSLLRGAIDPAVASRVSFRSMEVLGRNPAWIIPAWFEFLRDNPGSRARGIGEPVWPGRSADELVECARHETLLNLAFAGAEGFTLLCPYDAEGLDAAVLDEAACTHPVVSRSGAVESSGAYRGTAVSDEPLTPLPATADVCDFGRGSVGAVRRWAASAAQRAGLSSARVSDLVVAVSEAVTNSIIHGGGRGTLAIWGGPDGVRCQVSDSGRIDDPLAGRIRPPFDLPRGRGMWIITQLSDLVQVRRTDPGQVLRLHFRR